MDPVVHFEMPYDNQARMAKFYESVFGWKTQMLGEDMSNYVLATTTETRESGSKKPRAINGGFFRKNSIGLLNIRPSLSRWTISKNQ